jgi:hypothetical protein
LDAICIKRILGHGVELRTLSIEALAALRDDVIAFLAEKVATKQRELESEIARINGLNGSAPAKPGGRWKI